MFEIGDAKTTLKQSVMDPTNDREVTSECYNNYLLLFQ